MSTKGVGCSAKPKANDGRLADWQVKEVFGKSLIVNLNALGLR
jgi:hypothetical protein